MKKREQVKKLDLKNFTKNGGLELEEIDLDSNEIDLISRRNDIRIEFEFIKKIDMEEYRGMTDEQILLKLIEKDYEKELASEGISVWLTYQSENKLEKLNAADFSVLDDKLESKLEDTEDYIERWFNQRKSYVIYQYERIKRLAKEFCKNKSNQEILNAILEDELNIQELLYSDGDYDYGFFNDINWQLREERLLNDALYSKMTNAERMEYNKAQDKEVRDFASDFKQVLELKARGGDSNE